MRFSERTNWEPGEHEFARAVRERRAAGLELVDLTVANPTSCDFSYDAAALLEPLSEAGAMVYEPESLGMLRAREAVSQYYREAGAEVSAKQICLTTSTSEAYSFLFRLLCDPGDEVLVARPSYPLFEYIARLDDVVLREYSLLYDPNADDSHGWSIDFHGLEQTISARTKAVIAVHPNNPTGNFVAAREREVLERICAERGLALIVDEVFLDYSFGAKAESFAVGETKCLSFVLSGISKVCGLPQMKASWIVAGGPAELVSAAMERIEIIADTFLSVNAPVQYALNGWLKGRGAVQQQIRERCLANLASLDERLVESAAQRLVVHGGWTVVLRVPRTVAGVDFVHAALERGVLVQPGEFYGLAEGRVVLSLLTRGAEWVSGLALLPID